MTGGRLSGRVAVVTGAARGIGRAVTTAYAQEGAIVHALDVLGDEVATVAADLRAKGHDVRDRRMDLRDPDDVARTFAAIEAAGPGIDVLVNNAGVIFFRPVEAVTADEWDRILDINLRGPFLCIRAVAPGMKARRRGAILNVSSNAGVRGGNDESTYCASKFGIEGLSRALAIEFAPYNVSVNTVTPGHPVHTAMSETTYGPENRAIWKDPIEIAPAFVHLALQDASGINDRYVRAWDLVQDLRANGEIA